MPKKMPVLFVGHGSPLHAIADNSFTRCLRTLGESLPRPKAILMVSAHWTTSGTYVLGAERPRTIHDFYGFPEELFAVSYPAPGSPELAASVVSLLTQPAAQLDFTWGLDHGTWSVAKHLYPKADIPIVQLSIDLGLPLESHFAIGRQLAPLRERGILIVGSGNLVHNLQRMNWAPDAAPMDWAVEFDAWAKERLEARDFSALTREPLLSPAGKLSVPTTEHYLPVLYVLGTASPEERLRFCFEEIQHGTIGMRSFVLGEER